METLSSRLGKRRPIPPGTSMQKIAQLMVKCGLAGAVVLRACRANKGEPHTDWPRGLQALALSSCKWFADVAGATHRSEMWTGETRI